MFYREGLVYCDDHDLATSGLCMAGGQAAVLMHTGRWAEVEDISAGPLSGDRSSPINRVTFLVPLGLARARRGLDGVWEPLDEAAASDRAPRRAVVRHDVPGRSGRGALAGRGREQARAELAVAAEWAAQCPSERKGVALLRWRITGEVGPEADDLPRPTPPS